MQKIKVLFMQSQGYFGSDSMIHSLLMRNYDRSRVEVYVACNRGTKNKPTPALKAVSQIPDLHVIPTNFGPTINAVSPKQVIFNAITGLPFIFSFLKLAWFIKENNIKVIHGTEKPRDTFYGLILARLTGAKYIVHLHVKYEPWISPLVRWAMRHADGIIGVSEFISQSLTKNGYPSSKVFFVLNSLDATIWNPDLGDNNIRDELNIHDQTPVLAIISRLFPWKGHTELVKALSKVKESTNNFRLLVVGEDDRRATPGKTSYLAELKSLVKDLNLDEQIIFTGFRTDVNKIMAASDIYAMPSFEEPCAVVFLEAMAMRKPVIALKSGGTPQQIDQGKSGLLSEPEDLEQLTANIQTLLENKELRLSMGEYGRKRILDFFNPKRMADEVEEIYRFTLNRGKK